MSQHQDSRSTGSRLESLEEKLFEFVESPRENVILETITRTAEEFIPIEVVERSTRGIANFIGSAYNAIKGALERYAVSPGWSSIAALNTASSFYQFSEGSIFLGIIGAIGAGLAGLYAHSKNKDYEQFRYSLRLNGWDASRARKLAWDYGPRMVERAAEKEGFEEEFCALSLGKKGILDRVKSV